MSRYSGRASPAAPLFVALLLTSAAASTRAQGESAPLAETPAATMGKQGAAKAEAAGSEQPSVKQAVPGGPYLSSLGGLERESVEEALVLLGLTVDPSPQGKVIGHVYIVNQNVFSRHDWHFQLLNVFHRTTRSHVLGRELLPSPGQRWDPSLADETMRNLQSAPALFFADGTMFGPPQLSSVVVLVPVASPVPGTVDLLMVTRDLWSLRFNTDFEFQKNTLSSLDISLAENNLLGWRKYLAARFQMDQGRFGIGPGYFDPNIAGTRLTLLATATAWYARASDHYEGESQLFSLRYPLYSLASRWGAALDVNHDDLVVRQFCDEQLCPADVGGTSVPLIYRRRTLTVDANVVRSFGQDIIQRVTGGWRIVSGRSLVLLDFSSDSTPLFADEFLAKWAPLSETRSEACLRYDIFLARYGVFRDLDSFDLRENHRIGPLVSVELAAGLPALGADRVSYPMSATASWSVAPWGSGFGLAQVQGTARALSGQLIDQRLSAVLWFASPPVGRAARLFLTATADTVRADTYRTHFFLGGDNGLRGYQIGEFEGTVQALAHAEVRTTPLAVRSQRFGAVAFYDVGDAADSFCGLVPHHDLGVGIRWLIPQLNSSVLRIDWAVPLQNGQYTHPGPPGRISAGFMQSFWLLDSPRGYIPSS
jgi:Omp85 superfamily domain